MVPEWIRADRMVGKELTPHGAPTVGGSDLGGDGQRRVTVPAVLVVERVPLGLARLVRGAVAGTVEQRGAAGVRAWAFHDVRLLNPPNSLTRIFRLLKNASQWREISSALIHVMGRSVLPHFTVWNRLNFGFSFLGVMVVDG